jgi:DNA mismatch endonuclease, patch repair protein
MADIVTPEVRSRMMAGIRGKDTKPEMIVRRGLHAMGFRYRLHDKSLPGKPDLVFPKYKAVVFVHGCFWHKHDCRYFKWPKTRPEFWRSKISANVRRDCLVFEELRKAGWRIGVIWECALRQTRDPVEQIYNLSDWLHSENRQIEIAEDNHGN